MEQSELNIYVWKYFRWLQKITGCAIEEAIASNAKSFSFSHGTYEVQKQLVKILNSLNMGNTELAFVRCNKVLRYWFMEFNFSMKKNFTSLGLREVGDMFNEAAGYADQYDLFYPGFAAELMDEYKATGLLDGDSCDVTLENVGDVACDLETVSMKSENTRYLQIYTLTRGEKSLNFNAPFRVKDGLACCNNIDFLLSNCKPIDDDEIEVTIAMKIEEIIDYSYFLIFFQYKDTCFVVTDSIEFGNPHNMAASRNPRRRSESREKETGLPYRIIDDIIEWRENNNAIQKSESASEEKPMELYIKKLSEYMPASWRLNIVSLFKTMMKRVADGNGEFPMVGTFDKMLVSQKLLGSTVDMKSDDFKSSFEKTNLDKLDEFYASWTLPYNDGEKTTLPAPVIRDLSVMDEYRSDVLVTPEKARAYANYFVAKREADYIIKTMWDYYNAHHMEERRKMAEIVRTHLDSLLPYVFAGEEVYLVDMDIIRNHSNVPFMRPEETRFIIRKFSYLYHDSVAEHKERKWFHGDVIATKKEKGWKSEIYCNGCNIETNKGAIVSFTHWREFVKFLSIVRTDIPQSMRNYTCHYYQPYPGNSIIDNVNPLYLLRDPFSQRNANDFTVAVPFCGNCMRRLRKQYRVSEKSVILFHSNTGEVEDVIKYSDDIKERVLERLNKATN